MNRKDIENGRCFYADDEFNGKQPFSGLEKTILALIFIGFLLLIWIAL